MNLSSGYQKIKKYIKESSRYRLLSQWTSSHTVEMDDGTTLEERISNVDNTADINKPISTAQQAAFDKKADIASPTLTGTPKAPTASTGTNTTQIATTEFVQTAVSDKLTAVQGDGGYISHSQSGTVVSLNHKDIPRTDTTSASSPSSGDTFTAVKSITSDEKGHITGVNTETVTLPANIGSSEDTTGVSSTSSTAKRYLIGTEGIDSEREETYANEKCYMQNGYLYSNGKKVDTTVAENKNSIDRTQTYIKEINNSSGIVVSSLTIPSGGCSGLIKIKTELGQGAKGIIHISPGWTTLDDYTLLIPYFYLSDSTAGQINLIIWNLGNDDYVLRTNSLTWNVIYWY